MARNIDATGGQLLTVAETAERLRVSPSQVYALIWKRQLRPVDLSTRTGSKRATYRISEHEVARFLTERVA